MFGGFGLGPADGSPDFGWARPKHHAPFAGPSQSSKQLCLGPAKASGSFCGAPADMCSPLRSESGGFYLPSAASIESVILWSYMPIANLPQGVELRDASAVLPVDRARCLLSRVGRGRVAHLADIARLMAMVKSPGASWFVDGDVVWLRDVRA
eukprot:13128677-Alexandrium_andersonii.AAC.1